MASRISTEEMAELCALADGTLPADRRAEVEARVAASREHQELFERQRVAVLAAQTLSTDRVPESLQAAVEARRDALGAVRRRGRLLTPLLALAGAAAVAAVVIAVVPSGGNPAAPTVRDAARLATLEATTPAPLPAGGSGTQLAIDVEGVPFPDFTREHGWRALGARRGRVEGRSATVVFYGKAGRRLSYVIVAGDGLSRPSKAEARVIDGVTYHTLHLGNRLAVTWRRAGHTCVLIGQAPRAELLELASRPLNRAR